MSKSNRGDILILIIGLLSLLLVAILTYLVTGRTGVRIASYGLSHLKAREIAETGITEAILRLKGDENNFDHYGEAWHLDFVGDEVDNDEDGRPESRWFNLQRNGELYGRYAVLVEDESAKININACGNLSREGRHSANEGWSIFEIRLENLPGIEEQTARKIFLRRYGANGLPGTLYDDDRDNAVLKKDGIDNNANGFIDEAGEGVNEPDEFSGARPCGDDIPFISLEDLKEVAGIGPTILEKVKNLITIFSYDKNRDREGNQRINLNTASLKEIIEGLKRSGFNNEAQIYQVALNILDYRDQDSIPSSLTGPGGNQFFGLEKTPYLNEIETAPDLEEKWQGTLFVFWWSKGEFVELFNPYEVPLSVSRWRVGIGNFFSLSLPGGASVPPRGYYTVGDRFAIRVTIDFSTWPWQIYLSPDFTPNPPDCSQYEEFFALPISGAETVLADDKNNIVEITNYGPDFFGKPTRQKNDPRLRGPFDWFCGPPSPNRENALFLPEIGLEVNRSNWQGHFLIKNNPFSQVGELGCIHRMQQWQTINLWKNEKIDLRTQDIFTTFFPVEEDVPGRLNINTAPPEVLANLPFLNLTVAKEMVPQKEPYTEIGEVSPRLLVVFEKQGSCGHNLSDDDGDGLVDEDDERELPYRRISNLITVQSNVFRITVTGQSVEDFNRNGKIEENEIMAEKKITAIYDRGGKRKRFLQWKIK